MTIISKRFTFHNNRSVRNERPFQVLFRKSSGLVFRLYDVGKTKKVFDIIINTTRFARRPPDCKRTRTDRKIDVVENATANRCFHRSTLPNTARFLKAHTSETRPATGTGECLSNLNVAELRKITLEIVDIIVRRDTPGRGKWRGG